VCAERIHVGLDIHFPLFPEHCSGAKYSGVPKKKNVTRRSAQMHLIPTQQVPRPIESVSLTRGEVTLSDDPPDSLTPGPSPKVEGIK